jgi:hypothetical protein
MSGPLTCSLSAVFVEGERHVLAYVPEIAGAHAQGRTVEEARANLAQALELIVACNRRMAHESFAGCRVIQTERIRAV